MITPLSRTLRGALLALALVALGPVTDAIAAPALKVPAAPAVAAAAEALGATHWQREACGGQVAITWEHLGSRRNAESRWSAPAGGDPSSYMRCTIAFSLDARWDWPKFCTVTEHELGHLNVQVHVDDESDVMSPFYLEATPECRKAPMPGAPKAKARSSARRAR